MSTPEDRSDESVSDVTVTDVADVAIVGGGPAGAAAARLLAERGHQVSLFARDPDPVRAFIESVPPSARQLLTTIGALDAIDGGGFVRSYGNTVWWGEREGADERFGGDTYGFQVFRPRFDAMLLDHAAAAGADIWRGATVSAVTEWENGLALRVVDMHREVHHVRARFVLDCSGRSGVMARRHRVYEPTLRGQALIGVWRAAAWPGIEAGHTLVESWEDGWGWSVPAGNGVRQVGILVDGSRTGVERGQRFEATYRAALARMRRLQGIVSNARLDRAWACDASVYASQVYGRANYLLAGDAASFIEPLSSFGVKKALASGWMAALTAHTWLRHPERRSLALQFFTAWEREVYATSVARSQQYAREAVARYRRPFWTARAAAAAPAAAGVSTETRLSSPAVQQVFERLRSASFSLRVAPSLTVVPRPVIRGGEIVPEDAIVLADDPTAIRFVRDIDVYAVVMLARAGGDMGALVARYVERFGSHTLPNLLAAVALLVERGALIAAASVPTKT